MINVTIVNPVLLIVFVGTPVLYLVVGLGARQPEVLAGRSCRKVGTIAGTLWLLCGTPSTPVSGRRRRPQDAVTD